MRVLTGNYTPFVTAISMFVVFFAFVSPSYAQEDELEALYEQLINPVDGKWQPIEKRIQKLWSKSGSDAMDLLLKRGRNAMHAGKLPKAVEHFTALTDHAPDFAEGWNARATAYFLMEAYGPSIADIQKTLDLNPHHFGAMAGLGLIMEQLDQPEHALTAFLQAQTVHPHRPNIIEAIKRLKIKTRGQSL